MLYRVMRTVYLTSILSTTCFYLIYIFRAIESEFDQKLTMVSRSLLGRCPGVVRNISSLYSILLFPFLTDLYGLSWPFRYECKTRYVRESQYAMFCDNISVYVLVRTSVSNFSKHFRTYVVFTTS